MDKYLPHSTLADMNATHLDIERVRIAAQQRAEEMVILADALEFRAQCADEGWTVMLRAAELLRQLAEGK